MANIRLSKIFYFEAAHALYGYDGKCKNIHGHSYKLQVTVIGQPLPDPSNPKYGMVMDFGELKDLVKKEIISVFDHAIVLNGDSPHAALAKSLADEGHNIVLVDYQPTSEYMILDFVRRLQPKLPKHVSLYCLKLQETNTSAAEWYAGDN